MSDNSPVIDPNTGRAMACECGAPLKWRDGQEVCPYGCLSIDEPWLEQEQAWSDMDFELEVAS